MKTQSRKPMTELNSNQPIARSPDGGPDGSPQHHPNPATELATPDQLRIGGITAMTTVDFPGELAAVVFCQGCPWRCRYCHNAHLLSGDTAFLIPWAETRALLERRRGLLDAIVFSGGEPTLQGALSAAMAEAKGMGYKVGLHTGGCYPERLRPLLPHLDWVGLDIKALPNGYPDITGVKGSGEPAWKSLKILLSSGVEVEVRTTVMPGWSLETDLDPLMERLSGVGVRNFAMQACRTENTLDPKLSAVQAPPIMWDLVARRGHRQFERFAVRAA